jgi:hypothetical protein
LRYRAEEAYLAHGVLNHSTHVTDGDESTRSIEEADHSLVRDISGCSRGPRFQPAVPCARDDDEEQEDQDLQDETTEDDVLAHLDTILIFGLHKHTSTAALDKETKDISSHEDLCEPVGAYERVRCGVSAHDQASEDHVDGGSEQDRGDQGSQRIKSKQYLI